MNTTALRLATQALIVLVTLGLPIERASADVTSGERAPSRAAGESDPVELHATTRSLTPPEAPATSLASAPAADGSLPPSPTADAPDMEQLAARAAARPAPVSDDDSLAALDAVLSDETTDPISGVSDEPVGVEPEGMPRREDVQRAIALVVPSIRACVSGQSGRVVSVSEVFDSSGRVRSTSVALSSAHFAPSERSCMARAARDARLPRFENGTFEVTFPVRL